MLKLETRRNLSRTVLTVCLSYVLALYLLIAGLASAAQTARSLDDALASLDPHTLCLTSAASESPDGSGSTPANPHHHDLCCTLACGSVALLAPAVFVSVAYAAASKVVVHPTSHIRLRLSTLDRTARLRPGTARPAL